MPTRKPADIARDIAAAVRELNHATIHGGYEHAPDVDATLAGISEAAMMLPQAIEQARTWLERAERDGRVGTDGYDDTVPADAVAGLWVAKQIAGQLYEQLNDTRQRTARLTGVEG